MTQDSPPPDKTGSTTLVAVVVTFNRFAKVQETIARLRSEGVDSLVVVDNGSSDGTREWLKSQQGDSCHVILTEANLGGAGGFERGMRHARDKLDPDWVVLMDDDGRPSPGAIARFRARDWSGWDGVAGAVFYPDGRICDMNRPLRNPFARGRRGRAFRIRDEDYSTESPPSQVDMATFVGLFLSRAALAEVHGPDPRLFIYGDDLMHTLKLSQAGCRIAFAPDIRFEHDCATMAGAGNVYRPLWKVYYHHRNGILLYRQAAGLLAWPIIAARLPKWWLAARHYGDDAAAYRRLLRRAIRDGVTAQLDAPPVDIPGPPRA